MTPAQIAALRTFLAESLQAPPRYGADPVAFPLANVVRSNQDHPRGTPLWCTVRLLASTSLQATGDVWGEATRMRYLLRFDGNTGAVTVTLDPRNSTFGPATTGAVSSGGDAEALRDAVLSALQALEGPDHPAVYEATTVEGEPGIEAVATEAARGVWLDIEADGDDVTVIQARDALATHTRDLGEDTWSIQVSSRLLAESQHEPPNDDLHAVALLTKVRTRAMSPIAAQGLHAAAYPVRRASDVRDLTHLLRGSQWETRAVLDLTLGVTRGIVEEPGTVEAVEAIGTVAGATFTIDEDG